MEAMMIAPCGLNCAVCYAHLRDKRKCDGCRGSDDTKMPSCLRCVMRNCEERQNDADFCYDCGQYPCQKLKQLDKRYRTRYAVHVLEDLQTIRNEGIDIFLEQQRERWACKTCGSVICMHKGYCETCEPKQ